MYRRLGEIVSGFPTFWIVIWIIGAAVAIKSAPESKSVSQDGELAFLPIDSSSRQAELLFRAAFPVIKQDADSNEEPTIQQDPLGSNIVIVLERDPNGKKTLNSQDTAFIQQILLPELESIRETTGRGIEIPEDYAPQKLKPEDQVIKGIVTEFDERIGALLRSPDEKATLMILELSTEFLDRQNNLVLARIEKLLSDENLQNQKPLGLSMALSGSATVGRDMLRAEAESAHRTELFTTVLLIGMLVLIYRSPLLALVPLVTVGVAVALTKALLKIMASWGWIGLFTGLEVYVTVVVYGAGVDYCLFLIARYKEELEKGMSLKEAISHSVYRVGGALATSAGTSIVGIGMMGFSEFGKFRQAGFAISFGLFVVLLFALTFTPALLLLFGKWAFWPQMHRAEVAKPSGWVPSSSLWNKFREQRWIEQMWQGVAWMIYRRPGTVFIVTILLMMPWAVVGVVYQDDLSYGVLTDLPQDEPSVEGANAVQKHFPAGVTGPITMFVRFDKEALNDYMEGDDLTHARKAERLSKHITEHLLAGEEQRKAQQQAGGPPPIGITDIRNQTHPLGMSPEAQEYMNGLSVIARGARRTLAHKTYTSLQGPIAGEVMRLDIVLDVDPFSREAITKLGQLEIALRDAIPLALTEEVEFDDAPAVASAGLVNTALANADGADADPAAQLRNSAIILPMGTTPGIRDLKDVTDRDRIRIDLLVALSVYLVLVALIRRPEICAYLIVSVIFSYLVTMGVTYIVFYLRDPTGFTGLDWKIPVYLFTILIAIGEDYNILLMARITEEQPQRGLTGGVLYALMKTGGIISTCGIIMAGTFCSLMAGTLLGMVQMGFALAFGVLLDTFVVRPILVPAYLVLLYSGRFGRFGRFLGGPSEEELARNIETDFTSNVPTPVPAAAAAATAEVS